VSSARRFPPPWSVQELEACFIVTDSAGQKLVFIYFEEEPGRRAAAKLLTRDEAHRIAVDIAKLPELLRKYIKWPRPHETAGAKVTRKAFREERSFSAFVPPLPSWLQGTIQQWVRLACGGTCDVDKTRSLTGRKQPTP
jgi:hypothetical protein